MNFLSIDVGTTCCKCQLFSEDGDIVAYRGGEYPFVREDGTICVNIGEIWARVKELISFAAEKGGFSSLCISTFGESFVLLGKDDEILSPPMTYTDPRGTEEAEELRARFGDEELFLRTGVVPQSLFSLSKLLWIQKHRPDLFERADKVLLIGDYLGYLLTGERVIDYGLASRTGVFHLERKKFDDEILGFSGVPASLFSAPKPAGSIVGKIKKSLCLELGLREECTLVLGSHDQICAALGAGAVRPGDAVDGMGTVECITTVFEHRPKDASMGRQGYSCIPYAVDGLYCTYLFHFASGALVNWFRKNLLHGYTGGETDFFSYIEQGMQNRPTGILCLPYFAGAATPYQNAEARGAFLNLTTETRDADLYRAILEATAMEMRLNAETVAPYGISVGQAVASGGGANSLKWLQIKADIQNIAFQTLRSSEGGLCGCAMLQAVAMGKAKDLADAAKLFVQFGREFSPDAARHAAYEAQYQKYKKLYRTLKEFL